MGRRKKNHVRAFPPFMEGLVSMRSVFFRFLRDSFLPVGAIFSMLSLTSPYVENYLDLFPLRKSFGVCPCFRCYRL